MVADRGWHTRRAACMVFLFMVTFVGWHGVACTVYLFLAPPVSVSRQSPIAPGPSTPDPGGVIRLRDNIHDYLNHSLYRRPHTASVCDIKVTIAAACIPLNLLTKLSQPITTYASGMQCRDHPFPWQRICDAGDGKIVSSNQRRSFWEVCST